MNARGSVMEPIDVDAIPHPQPQWRSGDVREPRRNTLPSETGRNQVIDLTTVSGSIDLTVSDSDLDEDWASPPVQGNGSQCDSKKRKRSTSGTLVGGTDETTAAKRKANVSEVIHLSDGEHTPTVAALPSGLQTPDNAIICDICDRSFTSSSAYVQHLNEEKCEKSPGVDCPICGLRFPDQESCTRHYDAMHDCPDPSPVMEPPSDGRFACPACSKVVKDMNGHLDSECPSSPEKTGAGSSKSMAMWWKGSGAGSGSSQAGGSGSSTAKPRANGVSKKATTPPSGGNPFQGSEGSKFPPSSSSAGSPPRRQASLSSKREGVRAAVAMKYKSPTGPMDKYLSPERVRSPSEGGKCAAGKMQNLFSAQKSEVHAAAGEPGKMDQANEWGSELIMPEMEPDGGGKGGMSPSKLQARTSGPIPPGIAGGSVDKASPSKKRRLSSTTSVLPSSSHHTKSHSAGRSKGVFLDARGSELGRRPVESSRKSFLFGSGCPFEKNSESRRGDHSNEEGDDAVCREGYPDVELDTVERRSVVKEESPPSVSLPESDSDGRPRTRSTVKRQSLGTLPRYRELKSDSPIGSVSKRRASTISTDGQRESDTPSSVGAAGRPWSIKVSAKMMTAVAPRKKPGVSDCSDHLYDVRCDPFSTEPRFVIAGCGKVLIGRCTRGQRVVITREFNFAHLDVRPTTYEDDEEEVYGDPEDIYRAEFLHDPETKRTYIVAAGTDGLVWRFDCGTFEQMSFGAHGQAINDISRHPKEPIIFATASNDMSARIFNGRTGSLIAILNQYDAPRTNELMSIAWHESGNMLLTGNQTAVTSLWDLTDPRLTRAKEYSYRGQPSSMPDGNQLSGPLYFPKRDASTVPSVSLHTVPRVSMSRLFNESIDWLGWCGDCCLVKSTKCIIKMIKPAVGTEGKFGYEKEVEVQQFAVEENIPEGLYYVRATVSRSGRLLAASKNNGEILIWNVPLTLDGSRNPKRPIRIRQHKRWIEPVRALAFSNDERMLVVVTDLSNIF
ncbi:hypothetical protein HK104_002586, partial [Borealophlyctis nickersoniae]